MLAVLARTGERIAMTTPLFCTVKFTKLNPNAKTPTRAHESDAGNDLYALQGLIVPPGAIAFIPTGIAISLPPHTYGRVADRSSMSIKGWRVGAGVIDCSYTGEIAVVLQNMTQDRMSILPGQKVAQLIVTPVYEVDLEEVGELTSNARGTRGFGSSGS